MFKNKTLRHLIQLLFSKYENIGQQNFFLTFTLLLHRVAQKFLSWWAAHKIFSNKQPETRNSHCKGRPYSMAWQLHLMYIKFCNHCSQPRNTGDWRTKLWNHPTMESGVQLWHMETLEHTKCRVQSSTVIYLHTNFFLQVIDKLNEPKDFT